MVVSHELARAKVDHVVFERGRIGETWRGRWDSFCLVTPNWTVQLPSHPYDGQVFGVAEDAAIVARSVAATLEQTARA